MDVVTAGEITYGNRNIVGVDHWETHSAEEASNGDTNRDMALGSIILEWDPFGDVGEYIGFA